MDGVSRRGNWIGVISLAAALATSGIAAADPVHDSITGGFKDHFEENVSLQAQNGPGGQDPSGHENATRPGGTRYRLDVTCLEIQGNLAAYSTLITKSNDPDFPAGTRFVEVARDGDAPNGEGDGWDLFDAPPADPNDCASFLDEAAASPDILGGNIKIHDAQQ